MTDPKRPKENVTEWAKSELCWKRVQELAIPINSELRQQLVDPLESRPGSDRAAVVEHLGLGIHVKDAVMRLGGSQWDDIRQWAMRQTLLTTRENDLLRAASRVPRFLPSEKQCEEIWKIRTRLVEKGYR